MQNCPLCGNISHSEFLSCKDYLVSGEQFKIVECTQCGMMFTIPKPDSSEIGKYYQSTEYVSHSDTKKGLINKIYHIVRKKALKKKFSIVKKYSKAETLADVGCATGAFASICQKNGIKVKGFEPDVNSRNYAIEVNKIEALPIENFFDNDSEKFDAITLWHVLEHVEDLHKYFVQFKKRLDEGGVLILALPNPKCFDASFYKEHWAAFDVPRHLYHFSQKQVLEFAQRHDFEVVDILPMKMDSYYISMLSEHHRYGKNRYFRAFINGFKSNRIAKKNGEYSSLIYILKMK